MLCCKRSFSFDVYFPEIQHSYIYAPIYGSSSFLSESLEFVLPFSARWSWHSCLPWDLRVPEHNNRWYSVGPPVLKFCLHFVSMRKFLLVSNFPPSPCGIVYKQNIRALVLKHCIQSSFLKYFLRLCWRLFVLSGVKQLLDSLVYPYFVALRINLGWKVIWSAGHLDLATA